MAGIDKIADHRGSRIPQSDGALTLLSLPRGGTNYRTRMPAWRRLSVAISFARRRESRMQLSIVNWTCCAGFSSGQNDGSGLQMR
jgi:hypothetical protein